MNDFDVFFKENSNKVNENTVLIIVCNAKSKTHTLKDYNGFSINTEFLSDEELKEITEMAEKQRLPFRIFYDEKDFMEFLIENQQNCTNFMVYNSAQNGIGPGRKALIPSICKFFNIRYTGSDPYRVCLCRDKFAVYSLLTVANIKMPKSELFLYNNTKLNLRTDLTYIAKPIYESSSLGITSQNVFKGTLIPYVYLTDLSKKMQQPILIQQFIKGYEIEVPVLVGKKSSFVFSPVVLHKDDNALEMDSEILDYNRIYNDDYLFSSFPNCFDDTDVKSTAEKVVRLLGLNGLCRVDFRYQSSGEFYVTDVSTNPHFINHSSVNFAFRNLGLKNEDIFKTILALS
ncbi:MAG: ATP-grasp domain-containing protein [Clostridiales bacterium]|nr:ATP-grasp domain-containing protein [Clostridiales bacterium]